MQEYLTKHNLKTKEDIAQHIVELKRNTIPNLELISSLSYYLFDGETQTVNMPFGREFLTVVVEKENHNKQREINSHVREAINSTRHKSQNGESHKELIFKDNLNLEEDYPERLGGQIKRGKIIDYSFGVKTNKDKPEISLLFKQFPKSLEAISACSQYGHEKYKETDKDYLNYTRVSGGSKTYADAGLRHRLQEGNDLESGLPHTYHIAWNALAELELWIKEYE